MFETSIREIKMSNEMDALREECQIEGTRLEQRSFELFAKTGWSALNKLLVKKGLITEKELLESFLEEAKETK